MCALWCLIFFFFNDTATTEIYTSRHTLSLPDALPISSLARARGVGRDPFLSRRPRCREARLWHHRLCDGQPAQPGRIRPEGVRGLCRRPRRSARMLYAERRNRLSAQGRRARPAELPGVPDRAPDVGAECHEREDRSEEHTYELQTLMRISYA